MYNVCIVWVVTGNYPYSTRGGAVPAASVIESFRACCVVVSLVKHFVFSFQHKGSLSTKFD